MKYEWVVDDFGWKWLMPKLSHADVEKHDLGTWDLADWTFGTTLPLEVLFLVPIDYRMSLAVKIVWKVENALRMLYWTLYFKNRGVLAEVVRVFRELVFKAGMVMLEIEYWKQLRKRYAR